MLSFPLGYILGTVFRLLSGYTVGLQSDPLLILKYPIKCAPPTNPQSLRYTNDCERIYVVRFLSFGFFNRRSNISSVMPLYFNSGVVYVFQCQPSRSHGSHRLWLMMNVNQELCIQNEIKKTAK